MFQAPRVYITLEIIKCDFIFASIPFLQMMELEGIFFLILRQDFIAAQADFKLSM